MSHPISDLSRTESAIEAYDAFDATYSTIESASQEEVLAWFDKRDALGEAVGVAFGLDTADRNSMEVCRSIRPGYENSFVRRAVAQWKARNAEQDGK